MSSTPEGYFTCEGVRFLDPQGNCVCGPGEPCADLDGDGDCANCEYEGSCRDCLQTACNNQCDEDCEVVYTGDEWACTKPCIDGGDADTGISDTSLDTGAADTDSDEEASASDSETQTVGVIAMWST